MPEEREDESKIRVVDRRMLTDDERAGKGVIVTPNSAPASNTAEQKAPKLEIVGGGAQAGADVADEIDAAAGDDAAGEADDEELTPEEEAQLRQELEEEQFAAMEKQMGRPLTEKEKDLVREEMKRQAQQLASLEIAPMLLRFAQEMSQLAAIHLGLMPNPMTRLIARNDAQAQLAIDAFGAIFELLKPQLDPASQREFSRVLNDLRVNYVSVTGAKPGGSGRIIH